MSHEQVFSLEYVAVQRGESQVLRGLSGTIPRAAVTAIIGPSGSGKSTLLRLLNRFEEPTRGTIHLDGQPLPSFDVHALRRRVVLVAQHPTMLTPTVGEDLRVGRPGLTDEQANALLMQVALPELGLDRQTSTLSGGEMQRVTLARSLAVEPEVLLLDEPTSALDEVAAHAVDHVIGGLVDDGLTVVLVSHDLHRVAHLADHVLVLDAGQIAERGRPDEIGYLS